MSASSYDNTRDECVFILDLLEFDIEFGFGQLQLSTKSIDFVLEILDVDLETYFAVFLYCQLFFSQNLNFILEQTLLYVLFLDAVFKIENFVDFK